jgi:hypothetical protein
MDHMMLDYKRLNDIWNEDAQTYHLHLQETKKHLHYHDIDEMYSMT